MMDRYQLRYFLAVVDQGNFSRAAAHCNVTQPTLSTGIAKLERAVGATLFLRSNQRVELTAAGSKFLLHARRIEQEFNLARQAMTGATSAPLLRVGVLRSIPNTFVAGAVGKALRHDPSAQIELIEGTERELIGHLARGRVNLALTLVDRGADQFLEELLSTESYALAMPAHHPLATRSVIAGEDLADDVMLLRRHCEALSETSRHFTDRGVRPRFAYRATNDERMLEMVAAGLGITVMPSSYRHPGVCRPRMAGFDVKRRVGLLYGPGDESLRTEPIAFIGALRAAFSP